MANEIHFHITKERVDTLRVGEWRAMERGTLSVDKMFDLMAKFMVNGDGVTYLEPDTANATLDNFTVGEVSEIIDLFGKNLSEFVLPKANGAPS